MASSPSPLPPPPSAGADQTAPTTPPAASPAPATPAPQMQQGTQMVMLVVQGLRAIAKGFPAAAPAVAEANDVMRKVMAAMMESQGTGEAQAPPIGQ